MTHEQITAHKKQRDEEERLKKVEENRKRVDAENAAKDAKLNAKIELEDKITTWAGPDKNRNNIRTLLCTINNVLWDGAEWKPVSFTDLMNPGPLKKAYFRAINTFHPDKN